MFEEVLRPEAKKLLVRLTPANFPLKTYLGGGTAIALHLGHRRSADLDFFTPTEFAEAQWEQKLKKQLGFELIQRDWQTLVGAASGVKISLLGYHYPEIGKRERVYQTSVASLTDLAAMKLETVIGRGTKRDFFDIYFLAQKFSLPKLFGFYQGKFQNLKQREIMIKKALVFFEEADRDEMPDLLVPVAWQEVKRWMVDEVKKLS